VGADETLGSEAAHEDPGREAADEPGGAERLDRLERSPSFGGSIGGAIGAAMLGLEEALRSQPPPQVRVAEHRPVRGLSGREDEDVLVFPDGPFALAERPEHQPEG
jgi:hypothetical protein